MAPSAIYYDETVSDNMKKAGAALEAISDAIDEVNLLKAMAADKLRLNTNLAPPSPPLSSSSLSSSPSSSSPSTDATTPFTTITTSTPNQNSTFRDYNNAKPSVKTLYTEQHTKQTLLYNLTARQNFHSLSRVRPSLTIWEAMEKLNTLIDESDPDTNLNQIQHLLQSAEAIRRDGKPRWMQLTGLIHDLGKLMFYFDSAQGQWDVVGDTFPVGCAYSEKCIFPETFRQNPDYGHDVYSTQYGIYSPGCGMENLIMSWGHDEYLYLVVRDQSTLPREALAMIRFGHRATPFRLGL